MFQLVLVDQSCYFYWNASYHWSVLTTAHCSTLPDPPTDDSNTEYSKPVEIDNLPPLAENDYEVLEEVRREKEKTPGKVE